MLFLGIVQQQAELHALAGKLAVGKRAHAGEDGDKAGLRIGFDSSCVAAPSGVQLSIISCRSETSSVEADFR